MSEYVDPYLPIKRLFPVGTMFELDNGPGTSTSIFIVTEMKTEWCTVYCPKTMEYIHSVSLGPLGVWLDNGKLRIV